MPIRFRLCAAILAFTFTTSIKAEEPRPFDVLKTKVMQCISNPKLAASPCDLVNKTMKEHAAVRKGGSVIFGPEMKIRTELRQLGLELPDWIIPIAYKSVKRKHGDFIVVFDWNYGHSWNPPSEREDIDYIIHLGKLFSADYDGGHFNQLHIFIRSSSEKTFKSAGSHRVHGELLSEEYEHLELRPSFWFDSNIERHCISPQGQPTKQFACLTYSFSTMWPEVHVWQDWRASTGIQISSFAFDGQRYNRLIDAIGRYKIEKPLPASSNSSGSNVIFWVATRREGYTETWSYAHPGRVMIWNDAKKELVVSEDLTKKYIPIKRRKLTGKRDEPASPGFFEDINGTIYEFVP